MDFFRRGLGHWRDQRPDRLRLAGDMGQPKRGEDLPEAKVKGQQPPRADPLHPGNQRLGALLKPVTFEQGDDRR